MYHQYFQDFEEALQLLCREYGVSLRTVDDEIEVSKEGLQGMEYHYICEDKLKGEHLGR